VGFAVGGTGWGEQQGAASMTVTTG